MEILKLSTTENRIVILVKKGTTYSLFHRTLNTPDDIWEKIDLPVVKGKNKNVRVVEDKEKTQ